MKKFILIMLLCLTVSVWAITPNEYLRTKNYLQSGNKLLDPLYLHMVQAANDYTGTETGIGDKYYVDSNAGSSGVGTSWDTAVLSLKEGIAECSANQGDIIYVAQHHDEEVDHAEGLDANIAGITIIGLGSGDDMPVITFITNSTAELTISAADVTIYNIRFLSDVQVAAGILIAATGDGARIIGCQFREESSSKEQLVMINVTGGANDLVIMGNSFIGADGGSATSAIVLLGASDRTVIADNYFYGEWSDYVILASGATSTEMLIKDNVLNNYESGGELMTFAAASTGSIINNKCYGAGASFALLGDAMFVSPDNVFMNTADKEVRNYETMFGAFTGVSGAGQGNSVYADMVLNATAHTDIITDIASAVPQPPAVKSLQDILHKDTGYGYLKGDHSLEAIGDDTDAIISTQTSIIADIVAMNDSGYVGTNSATSTTAPQVALLADFGEDYFNTGWSMIVIHNVNADGSAPEGEIRDITDYVSDTGIFTVNYAFTSTLQAGDQVMVKRTEDLELDIPTILGSSGTIWYVSSITGPGGSPAGDGTGRTWENAFATLTAADAVMGTGDVCYIDAGHSEIVATGSLSLDNAANMSFIGLGEGNARPLITISDDGTLLTINNAGITVKNIRLRSDVSECNIGISVGSAGIGCTLDNVSFIDGAHSTIDEFTIGIVVDAAADNLTIKNCTYYSLDTNNHVENFIDISHGATDSVSIIGCTIYGDFQEAAIWGDSTVAINLLIEDNVISNTEATTPCIDFNAAATGVCAGNRLYSSDYGTNGEDILDPGSMICIDNWATDAINQQAIRVPLSATTDDVTAVADGSDLERLEYLQQLTIDAIAFFDVGTGSIFYVDDAVAQSTGIDWANAVATIDDAVNLCTANAGDFIFVAPGHTEDLGTTDPDFDAANAHGVTCIGLGKGEQRPVLSFDGSTDIFTIDADDVSIYNLVFLAHDPDIAKGIDITANSENAIIEDCLFTVDTEGTDEFLIAINIGADADNVVIRNCEFFMGGGDAVEAILQDGALDYALIEGCKIYGDYTTACIYGDSTAAGVMLTIRDNILYNGDITIGLNTQPCIELKDDTTGFILNNSVFCDETWPELSIIADDCYLAGNTYSETESAGSVPIGKNYAVDALVALGIANTGGIWYVDSDVVSALENGITWGTATDTLKEAVALCTTNFGDVIFIAPGHTEVMGAGADEVDINLNNITVIGLGEGDARPLFDYSAGTTTGAFAIGANNVTIRNLRFLANVTGVNEAIEVEAGSLNCHIIDCMFELDSPGTDDFTECIDSGGTASDGLHVIGCSFYMGAGTCNSAILMKDSDHAVIKDNIMYGDYAVACINQVTTASNHITIENNILFNGTIGGDAGLNDQPGIEVLGTTSGVIRYNHIGTNLATMAEAIVAAHCYLFENYYNEDNSSAGTGGLIGTASANDP